MRKREIMKKVKDELKKDEDFEEIFVRRKLRFSKIVITKRKDKISG